VAPWLTPKRSMDRFVLQNLKWIEKQVDKVEQQRKLRPEFKYRSGDTFYYFGEPVTLVVEPSDRKRPDIKIREDQLVITLHRDIGKTYAIAAIKKTIENFYRKKAEEVIHDRLQHFNEHYGFRYNRVTLRNQKSRWGSCSAKKNLNFNWRLIMAPIEVIDYVVVHELCHLKEMNHSARYWALVKKTLPNHKLARKWLKDYHYLLRV
jgi:predicted metal-dependent hydrolase